MLRPSALFPLFSDVGSLPGIGPKLKEALSKLDILTVGHLLWHLPIDIIDRRYNPTLEDAVPGKIITLKVRIEKHDMSRRKGMPSRIRATDGTASIELIYFNAKYDYLERIFPIGMERAISGRVEKYQGKLTMPHPDYVAAANDIEKLCRLEPVYPLTAGLGLRVLHKAIHQALARVVRLPEWLDPSFKAQMNWPDWHDALKQVHQPKESQDISPESPARQRLAYDELLASQLALFLSREKYKRQAGQPVIGDNSLSNKVRSILPYQLTTAQNRALLEIKKDMAAPTRMLRMLQGDVGSGKTIVAFLALLNAIETGGQGVLLAPTDILARQHFKNFEPLADEIGINITLITGRDRTAREKKTLELANGQVDLIIGTHALLQEDIRFKDLKIAIIDEQHRFGVDQRLALAQKGRAVDLLVMTATPIPRTLLMAAYGDIDVSKLDEKPPGRKPIDTRIISLDRLDDVTTALRRGIKEGAQIYWVCPLVTESELSDLAAATERHRHLAQQFRVGLAHGKQKLSERNQAIAEFAAGNLDILVATTVIEVGIDIPRASVIVIEHAERFGLAQLHQLRGRVGRGSTQSSCLLLYQGPLSETAKSRLKIMRESEDGFRIAEEDLRLRGGGEILGTRQSGLPDFRLVNLSHHQSLLGMARNDARLVTEKTLIGLRGEALRHLLYLFERDAAINVLRSG